MNILGPSSMDEVLANTTVKSMMGDLQIVGGGSGHFSLGMMQKQLASVGCQSFGQVPLASLPEHEVFAGFADSADDAEQSGPCPNTCDHRSRGCVCLPACRE